jgi:hypothetical protein
MPVDAGVPDQAQARGGACGTNSGGAARADRKPHRGEADTLEAICARIIPSDANGPARAKRGRRISSIARSAARSRNRARRIAPASRRSIATADRRAARASPICRNAIRIRC